MKIVQGIYVACLPRRLVVPFVIVQRHQRFKCVLQSVELEALHWRQVHLRKCSQSLAVQLTRIDLDLAPDYAGTIAVCPAFKCSLYAFSFVLWCCLIPNAHNMQHRVYKFCSSSIRELLDRVELNSLHNIYVKSFLYRLLRQS